jgi:CRISPR-associated protein Cas1
MIKKTIYIGNPARLSLRHGQMLIEKPEELVHNTIPVEDTGILILDHSQITLTHGLMEELVENNAAILFCNNKHMPHGLVLPMDTHSTFSQNIKCQIEASEPLKKQLWKQTVEAKIKNQIALLKKLGKVSARMEYLHKNVQSGDKTNAEGQAASVYWKNIFEGTDFTRGRFDAPPNNLLNYGYAILRSVIARNLVGSGMLPALGIHHRNKYNAFCLADDIMEPFRPYVDELVLGIVKESAENLPEDITKETKIKLLQIPVLDVEIAGKSSPLMVAAQRTTASLMRCFEGESRKIMYPEL